MSDAEALKEEADELAEALADGQMWLRQRMHRAIVRWIFTALLYYAFWDYAWVRWTLVIVLPMIALNIAMMFYLARVAPAKVAEMQALLAASGELDEDDEDEGLPRPRGDRDA